MGLQGSWGRFSSNDKKHKFFHTLYKLVVQGAQNIIDIDDEDVVLPKRKDRILRVCIVNHIWMKHIEDSKDYDSVLCEYLGQQAKNDFSEVSWRDIRERNVHRGFARGDQNAYRNPRFLAALLYDMYGNIFFVRD